MPQLIHWSDEARADLRAIGREDALHILKNVARFVGTGRATSRGSTALSRRATGCG